MLLLGDGVVTSEGPQWRRKRALVQPTVRPRQVRSYAQTMTDCAAALAATWQPGQRIDVRREMLTLTQRIAVRAPFGTDTAGRDHDRHGHGQESHARAQSARQAKDSPAPLNQ